MKDHLFCFPRCKGSSNTRAEKEKKKVAINSVFCDAKIQDGGIEEEKGSRGGEEEEEKEGGGEERKTRKEEKKDIPSDQSSAAITRVSGLACKDPGTSWS